jgi:pimeloyl-ACP methyl ester carboxylesterase
MPELILLPGLACDAEAWDGVAAPLAAHHRIAVSDVAARHASLPAMAAALLAEHPGPLVLVGHSMGGIVALEALRQAPRRIAAAALLGSTARPDTPELVALRTQAIGLFEEGRIDEVLRANVPFAFAPGVPPALVERYIGMIRRAGAAALIAGNRALIERDDQRPLLPRIACPLLVACGEADALTPPEHSREIAAAVRDARLELLAGCGHMLTLEAPDRLAALLLDWLGRLDAVSASSPGAACS